MKRFAPRAVAQRLEEKVSLAVVGGVLLTGSLIVAARGIGRLRRTDGRQSAH